MARANPPLPFWNALLAAELPVEKSRALLQGLGSSVSDPVSWLLEHPNLSDAVRRQVREGAEAPIPDGARVLEAHDYPERMRDLPGMWPALWVQGDVSVLHEPTVAIVGTRRCGPYGRACATKFAAALAAEGVTVLSGLALGIDAAAHEASLAAGGRTAGVLPVGVDRVYPASNGPLYEKVLRGGGCLVSQFALGAEPQAYRFIARNHLIAALADVVLIVEAPLESGALTTARVAAELGRDVLVVPGGIDRDTFLGSNALIRDGAILVYHPNHVFEALGIEPGGRVQATAATPMAQRILSQLSGDPISVERLADAAGMGTSELLSELTMLELEGRVRREPGGYILAL